MGEDEVVELSIQETNDLRAKLGLKPLNVPSGASRNNGGSAATPSSFSRYTEDSTTNGNHGGNHDSQNQQKERLEMSVDETNALRATLGLAPLRTSGTTAIYNHDNKDETKVEKEDAQDGTSARKALHQPAANLGEEKEIQDRMERAKLERQVRSGISSKFDEKGLGNDEEEGALSWAEKLRASKEKDKAEEGEEVSAAKKKKKKKGNKGSKQKAGASHLLEQSYSEQDLEGISVGHSMAELEAGSTTILTLADAPLLRTQNDQTSKVVGLNEDGEQQTLQNIELAEQHAVSDGLRKKRQVELGLGRAGGYAGFDDDEFEELGGAQGPSRLARGGGGGGGGENGNSKNPTRGFRIGSSVATEDHKSKKDLFAFQQGNAVSLEPTQMDITASDFMTAEEDELLNPKSKKKSKKKKKKEATFQKKKKRDKKEKKLRRRKEVDSDEEEEDTPMVPAAVASKGLLESLEETAVAKSNGTKRKRRRSDSEDDVNDDQDNNGMGSSEAEKDEVIATMKKEPEEASKRAKFDKIMAKGNVRTATAFQAASKKTTEASLEDEPDDAFLNAALAKARRLRKLKEMSGGNTTIKITGGAADAVAQALQTARTKNNETAMAMTTDGGITFAADDTREFTRALRARKEQEERKDARNKKETSTTEDVSSKQENRPKPSDVTVGINDGDDMVEDPADMMELAKEINDDEPQTGGFDGTATNAAPIGRGLANALSMLRHTGEISGKNAGKEELRGRAKDERHYENYEKLDLDKVVKIGRNATDKDREFANREIKLEYRDEHGRLLTTKEAYRNLCYQFHGHGSSQKNEERRLRQIERERAEARLASRQVADDGTSRGAGTLGALKATQRATGKAFVVHKT